MIADTQLRRLGLGAPSVEDGPRPVLGLGRRVRSSAWVHRRSAAIVAVLLGIAGGVQAWGMTRSPMPIDDEGTYVAQAWAVQTEHRLAHYTYWYDHPPLGWMQISLWTWTTRAFHRVGHAVFAGRELMLIAALASAALIYVIARRLGTSRWAAALAVMLFALSPLAISYHRMVLLDNIAVPWALAALALVASPRRSLWAAAAGGLCFAVAVLSKETFLLLLPPLVVLLWQHCDRRTRSFCLTAFASVTALALVAYPLYAVLKGELVPGAGHVSLLDAVRFQLVSRAPSGPLWAHASPLRHTVAGWLALDPWLIGAGAVLVPAGLVVRRWRPVAVALLVQLLMLVRGGYVPGPFVVVALPLAALLVAGLADTAVPFLTVALAERRRHPTSGLRGCADRRSRGPSGPAANAARSGKHSGCRPEADAGGRVRCDQSARPLSRVRWAVGVAVPVLAVALVASAVAGPWYRGDRALVRADPAAGWVSAEQWIDAHVPRTDRVIVDDTMWVDLVDRGFSRDLGVVWFYKLDSSNNLDPSVQRRLPGGWREFGWIVSTPDMRGSLRDIPAGLQPVRQALANSTVSARFGTGADTVEVRRIDRAAAHP